MVNLFLKAIKYIRDFGAFLFVKLMSSYIELNNIILINIKLTQAYTSSDFIRVNSKISEWKKCIHECKNFGVFLKKQ